ncbi:hypothetical protein PC116_g11505 [Phytophthora cactorum]|nr:hypothetical protein PC116_g11505 [Phytophthora cactorum]
MQDYEHDLQRLLVAAAFCGFRRCLTGDFRTVACGVLADEAGGEVRGAADLVGAAAAGVADTAAGRLG